MADIWSFIRRYALRFKAWYLAGLLALLATNALSVAIPWFLEEGLKAADPAMGDGRLMRWVLAIFGAAIGVMIVRTASRLLIFIPGREAEYLLRNDFFEHLMALQSPFYRRMPPGDLLSRASNDIQFVRVLIGFAGLQILNVAFALPFNLYMMFGISAKLTIACVVPLVGALFIMRYGVMAMMTRLRLAREELGALSDEILESYNGVRVVQSYGAEAAMLGRFDERNDRYVGLLVDIAYIRAWLLPVVTVVGNVGILILLYWGGRMVATDELHFGVVSAYAVYVGNIVTALTSLGWVVNVVQRGQISLRRILDVLETDPDLPPEGGHLPDGPLGIEIDGLTFTYPVTGTEPALKDLRVSVPPGTTLGVFGATGSGKSTLVRLLTRLETPPEGTVRIGGVDVRDVPITELREAMATVPQTNYLFSRTLRENVAVGGPGEPDDDRVRDAVRRAGLVTDIAALPGGLETVVGERGVTLSGGQRQRTALARAFYRHARVLILDDTLSAVDHDTEQRLIRSIYEEAEGRTTVLISHRISALRHADQIIVLEDGALVEHGSHPELIAGGGRYAEAWRAQEDAERG